MGKIAIESHQAPAPIGPYSQALLVGNVLYASGIIPVEASGGEIPLGIEQQSRLVFTNMKAVLAAAGMDFKDVVKTTVFMTDLGHFTLFNTIYAEHFSAPFPARSCIEVSKLPKGVMLEVECIAVKE